ncbi:acetyl-CoA synthetase-like protein [Saccharata proteae CBS 121410]|uniref:Acetyl-CoA synthetase-like protein n=1 Tax=Saccharata proteae CBS 121410 TaxID=1314787 RepID=A0A9P4I4B9_9PEZI|nr:acetyl-CoA synthetase-like protein [Saccharata proteae CBS 121410]
MTHRVDQIAAATPERLWASIPATTDISGSWTNYTFADFARAVNSLSSWIEKNIGLGQARETVAYVGVTDLRYALVMLACMKTNHKALFLSLRNSDEGQISLIQRTNCTAFLHSESMESHVKVAQKASASLKTFQIPSMEELLSDPAGTQTFQSHGNEGLHEEVLVLHTSGSTGIPKPIFVTNGWIDSLEHNKYGPIPGGRVTGIESFLKEGTTMVALVPFFHTMGVICMLRSIIAGPIVVPRAGQTNNAILANKILSHKKPYGAIFPPAILEEMVETQEGLDAVSSAQYIWFGGAPLSQDAGDKACKLTNLVAIIGSTEANLLTNLQAEHIEDWNYFEWAESSGTVMEDAGDGLCEQVIKPIVDQRYQGVFYTFPDIKEWRTKDLFEPHPTKPNLWKYKGRRDDVIVFSNGEKFNPVSFEKHVENHPLVRGALVVGEQRFQAGLIVEPDWTKVPHNKDLSDLLEAVWPAVEEANRDAPAHCQVWKSKVAFTKPEKPFVRAPKGSIIRRQTVKAYATEIDALYSHEGFDDKLPKFDRDADFTGIRNFLRQAFELTLPGFKGNVSNDTDIFSLGVDSLQVMALSSSLSHAMKSDSDSHSAAILPRDIYGNPTVTKLAMSLQQKISGKGGDGVSREQKIMNMIEKYTADLPENVSSIPAPPAKQTVVLTGSTGSLGNYTLSNLIANPDVEKIYAMNRSDAEERQRKGFAERNAPADFSKVTFLKTDFSQARFGLSQEIYQQLLNSVTIFIHNAWAVDFNLSLESYESTHIAGTRRVVDFSLQSKYRAHINFISSIASVGAWAFVGTGPVPEADLDNPAVSLPQGYGEGKFVTSRILAIAAQRSGVPSTVFRCGQLAGSRLEGGVWNRHEWLPSIVNTSKAMAMLPRNLGNQDLIDWVPMDAAAGTVVDGALYRTKNHAEQRFDVFHVVNPRTNKWEILTPPIRDYFAGQGINVEMVDFSHWLSELKKTPLTPEEIEKKPGIKIADFYEGLNMEGGALPPMATVHTCEASETLRTLGAVDVHLMANWLKQWKF